LARRKKQRKKRSQKKYREFRRKEIVYIIEKIKKVVYTSPAPYKIKKKGTRGRTPMNPKDVVFALLIKAFFCLSYDSTHSFLILLQRGRLIRMKKIPAATTIQGLVGKIPRTYMEHLISISSKAVCKGNKRWNVAGDGTGIGTRKFQRWLDVRTRKKGKKKTFIKFHGMVTTDIEYPVYISAKVTHGDKHDSPMLGPMLNSRNKNIRLGDVCLDAGYPSRRNAKLIVANGGTPLIKAKKNVTSRSKGSIEWREMILFQRNDPDGFNKRYHRRPVIEGVIGAFKERFTDRVYAHKRHNQKMEVLSRVVVWNCISWAYHSF
jgi:transposase